VAFFLSDKIFGACGFFWSYTFNFFLVGMIIPIFDVEDGCPNIFS